MFGVRGVGFKASASIVFSRIVHFKLGFGSREWGSRERIQGWRLATEGYSLCEGLTARDKGRDLVCTIKGLIKSLSMRVRGLLKFRF